MTFRTILGAWESLVWRNEQLGKKSIEATSRSMNGSWGNYFFREKTQIAGWKIQCFEWYLPGSTVSLPEGVIFGGSLFLW